MHFSKEREQDRGTRIVEASRRRHMPLACDPPPPKSIHATELLDRGFILRLSFPPHTISHNFSAARPMRGTLHDTRLLFLPTKYETSKEAISAYFKVFIAVLITFDYLPLNICGFILSALVTLFPQLPYLA
jgi:hypothetical protein